jgi:hypothetical protein
VYVWLCVRVCVCVAVCACGAVCVWLLVSVWLCAAVCVWLCGPHYPYYSLAWRPLLSYYNGPL